VPQCQNFTITRTINNQSATTVYPNTNLVEFEKILVEGTFTLDKTITFKNCIFFFNENAALVTNGTVSLIGENTAFTPCDEKTWQGITINQNGDFSLTGCGIGGAEKALNLRKGYKWYNSKLIASTFSRSRYCIFGDQNGTIIGFKECHGNMFKGAGTLPGQPTVKPQAGIKVTSCVVSFGSIFYYPANDPIFDEEFLHDTYANTFRNFKYGVEASGGQINIRNCIFQQMRPEPGPDGKPTGCGISVSNKCQLKVFATDDPANNRVLGYSLFESCAFAGIKSVNSRTNISYAKFRLRQYYGIHSTANTTGQSVQLCNFEFGEDEPIAGISMDRPGLSPGVNISACNILKNRFTGGVGDGLACIEVRCPQPIAGIMTVADNIIDMTDGGYFYGIIVYGNQSNNIKLIHNDVNITSGGVTEFGIFLANFEGLGHELTSNTSTGLATCNFHIEKSRNVKYCNNTSDEGGNGFHFYGDDSNTRWSVNDIGAHGVGLFVQDIPASSGVLASNGKIGAQIRRGNMWESNDNLYWLAAQCSADPNESLFWVENENDNSIFPQKTDPANDWFQYVAGTLDYCGSGGGAVSDFEQRFAAGQVNTATYSAAEQWELRRLLLRTLMDNPGETNSNTVLQNYLAQNQNSTAGKFAKAEKMLADPAFASTSTIAQMESDVADLEDLLIDIDALTQASSWDTAQLAASFNTVANLSGSISAALDNVETSKQSHLAQVLDSIEAITVTQPYEEAWKVLKKFEVQTAMGLDPINAGYNDLETIANASQITYGPAVRHAWFYLPPCDRYKMIDPGETEEAPKSSGTQQSFETETILQVAPNPAAWEVTLSYPGDITGTWRITAASGQVVRSGNWSGTQTLVSVRELASGVYFATLIPDKGQPVVTKFAIQH